MSAASHPGGEGARSGWRDCPGSVGLAGAEANPAVRRVAAVAAPHLPSPYWRLPCRAEPWTGLPWSLGVALHLGPDWRPDHVLEGCCTQLTPLMYVVSEKVYL